MNVRISNIYPNQGVFFPWLIQEKNAMLTHTNELKLEIL